MERDDTMKENSMTSGNILKQLVLFSLPLLLGNLFQQLYNTVDSVIVGNFVGKSALAAVGASAPIINMLVGFFMGLATGASVVISQYYGAKDEKRLHDAVHTSMALTIVVGIAMTIIGTILSPLLVSLIGTPQDVFDNATLYLHIYFYGVLGLMVYNMGSGILRAVGDAKRPLYFLILSSIINIVLDYVFVVYVNMGIAGVAWATLIAQCTSAILVLLLLIRTKEPYRIVLKDLKMDKEMLKKVVSIGLPSGIQQSIVSFSNVIVQSYINGFGSGAMAGNSAWTKIDSFIMLPMQSFGLAATTFTGQNLGAKKTDRALKGARTALWLSIAVTISLSILVFFNGTTLLNVFSSDEEVHYYGTMLMNTYVPSYVFLCMVQIFAGVLRGAGDATPPMVTMIVCYVVIRQIYLAIISHFAHNFILTMMGFPLTWTLCAFCLYLHYRKKTWLNHSKIVEPTK